VICIPLQPARPIVVVFPRHVGCPFAERDIRQLVHLVLANPARFVLPSSPADGGAEPAPARKLQFLIAPHTDVANAREWFAAVLHAAYESFDPAATAASTTGDAPDGSSAGAPAAAKPDAGLIQEHFALFPDGSDRALAKAFGVGTLSSFGSLFSGDMFGSLSTLKAESGIMNRKTGGGSDRWATHGAFAVDEAGIVRWGWVAKTAHEEGDFEACVASLGV
jgi:hypothetical protein